MGLTQQVEFRNLNLRRGDTHTKAYLDLNKGGVVPTLVHEGRAICESNEILRYIDATFPTGGIGDKVSLTPRDPASRELMNEWLGRLAKPAEYGGLHAAIGIITSVLAIRHQYIALKKGGGWEPPADRKKFVDMIVAFGDSPSPAIRNMPAFATAIATWDRCLADMEVALSVSRASNWLCGFQFTLADCAFAPYLIRLEDLGLIGLPLSPESSSDTGLGMLEGRLLVRNYYQRIRERECFMEANTPWRNSSAVKMFRELSWKEWPIVKEIWHAKGAAKL